MNKFAVAALMALLALAGCPRTKSTAVDMAASKSTKKPTKTAKPVKPKAPKLVPMIDSHVHLTPVQPSIDVALHIFRKSGVTKFAVKSAGAPGTMRYQATVQLAAQLGDRMAFFSNLDWDGIDDPGWGKREADALERAVKDGASGIKIFKALGLGVRLKDGSLLKVDDPRLDPIFKRAGKLGAIIAWHVADPVAFFEPITTSNERYAELSMAPEWSFYGKDYPSHAQLLAARDRVVKKFPKTTFLGIHLGNYPENIDYVGKLLDQCPNFYVDVAARIPEIGRHPIKKLKAFFDKYQDRILFGTDIVITPRGFQLGSVSPKPPTVADAIKFFADHRRFFETDDRDFAHPTPIQGKWTINGVKLAPDVLKKVYVDNAERLIFSKRSAWLKAHAARNEKLKGMSPKDRAAQPSRRRSPGR